MANKKDPDSLGMVITPLGTAKYCHITEPDDRFAKGNKKAQYKISVVFQKGKEDVEAFVETIRGHEKAIDAQKERVGFDDDGNYLIEMASNYQPKCRDSKRKIIPTDRQIWAGSVVRCAVELRKYEGFGGGVSLRLKECQFKSIVPDGDGADYGFDDMDDGYSVDDDASVDKSQSDDSSSFDESDSADF